MVASYMEDNMNQEKILALIFLFACLGVAAYCTWKFFKIKFPMPSSPKGNATQATDLSVSSLVAPLGLPGTEHFSPGDYEMGSVPSAEEVAHKLPLMPLPLSGALPEIVRLEGRQAMHVRDHAWGNIGNTLEMRPAKVTQLLARNAVEYGELPPQGIPFDANALIERRKELDQEGERRDSIRNAKKFEEAFPSPDTGEEKKHE